jgi:hypothetical protein
MTQSTDGPTRLRKSGIGVVLGGFLLVVAIVLGLPFAGAAAIVVGIGLVGLVYGESADATQGSVGVLCVGAIALVEAAPGVGLGLDPMLLAGVAVVFGVFDVLAGLALRRLSQGAQ